MRVKPATKRIDQYVTHRLTFLVSTFHVKMLSNILLHRWVRKGIFPLTINHPWRPVGQLNLEFASPWLTRYHIPTVPSCDAANVFDLCLSQAKRFYSYTHYFYHRKRPQNVFKESGSCCFRLDSPQDTRNAREIKRSIWLSREGMLLPVPYNIQLATLDVLWSYELKPGLFFEGAQNKTFRISKVVFTDMFIYFFAIFYNCQLCLELTFSTWKMFRICWIVVRLSFVCCSHGG